MSEPLFLSCNQSDVGYSSRVAYLSTIRRLSEVIEAQTITSNRDFESVNIWSGTLCCRRFKYHISASKSNQMHLKMHDIVMLTQILFCFTYVLSIPYYSGIIICITQTYCEPELDT